jgi:hypothetical protein
MKTLPSELLAGILAHIDEVQSLLKCRHTAAFLRQPAADVIGKLVADDGVLPPGAWDVYRKATALIIRCAREPVNPEVLYELVKLVASLPLRVDSIRGQGPLLPRRQSAALSLPLAQALVASACAKTITTLDLGASVEPSLCTTFSRQAADAILAGLPALTALALSVKADAVEAWGPALPPGITSLRLALSAEEYDDPICVLDMSALAAATTLMELSIDAWCPRLANIPSLAALTNLRSVQLQHDWEWEDHYQESLPLCWKALSQLPKLDCLKLMSPVTLGTAQLDVQLTALQHLEVHNLEIVVPEERLSGCLTASLPNIKTMVVHEAASLYRLARGLRYHTSLQRLQHLSRSHCAPANGPWLQPQLATVSSLTSLDWQLSYEPYEADAMMSGLAACPALQELSLSDSPGFTLQQMTALAAGACGATLRQLKLTYQGSSICSLMAVSALFRGGLSRLERLVLRDMDCTGMLRVDQQKLRSVVAGDVAKYQLLQLVQAFAFSNELMQEALRAAGRALQAKEAAGAAAGQDQVAADESATAADVVMAEAAAAAQQDAAAATEANERAAAAELIGPPSPPPALPEPRPEPVPWTMVLTRATGAADVARITELQAAEANSLLQALSTRLLRPQANEAQLPPAEAKQLVERVALGLQLRRQLGGMLRKLFAHAATGERVQLSLHYNGCDISISVLLGTVVTYR